MTTSASGRWCARASASSRCLAARSCGTLRDDLGEAGDRQPAVVDEHAPARRANSGPARPATSMSGRERAQLAGERAGVQIAGRLAARQQQAAAQDAGRLNSAGSSGAVDLHVDDRRSSTGSPPTRTLAAKAICTPSTVAVVAEALLDQRLPHAAGDVGLLRHETGRRHRRT